MYDVQIPVLIVGGGPVGLSTALFSGRRGVATMLLEKRDSTSMLPRAPGLQARTMELFRAAGLGKEIRALEKGNSHAYFEGGIIKVDTFSDIDNAELLTSSRIVVRVGSELSDDALRRVFVQQATVGSAGEFDSLWKSRLPGIPLKPLHSQPREIPYDGDRLCLELDQKSEHWASLRDAPGFVIGVSGVLPSEPELDCYAVSR